jgi:hypothetical protein
VEGEKVDELKPSVFPCSNWACWGSGDNGLGEACFGMGYDLEAGRRREELESGLGVEGRNGWTGSGIGTEDDLRYWRAVRDASNRVTTSGT